MVGVPQLATRELAHPRLLVTQQLELTSSFFGIELGLVDGLGRRLVRSFRCLATTEDPAQEPHRAYS